MEKRNHVLFDPEFNFLLLCLLDGALLRLVIDMYRELSTRSDCYALGVYVVFIFIVSAMMLWIYQNDLKIYKLRNVYMSAVLTVFLGLFYPDVSRRLFLMSVKGILPPGYRNVILLGAYFFVLYLLRLKMVSK